MVVRRTLVLALLVGLVALFVGYIVAQSTFPSSEELQDEVFEQFGLDGTLFDSPLVRRVVDEVAGQVEDHVKAEARRSALLGAVAGGAVVVGGFALVLADARRRESGADATAVPPVG